jgi:hypothetical protein
MPDQLTIWKKKINDTTRRHAGRLRMSTEQLRNRYGWEPGRMLHDALQAYRAGCPYTNKPFTDPDDLSLDIHDPVLPPFYPSNTRWISQAANRSKARLSPQAWGRKSTMAAPQQLWLPIGLDVQTVIDAGQVEEPEELTEEAEPLEVTRLVQKLVEAAMAVDWNVY